MQLSNSIAGVTDDGFTPDYGFGSVGAGVGVVAFGKRSAFEKFWCPTGGAEGADTGAGFESQPIRRAAPNTIPNATINVPFTVFSSMNERW